MTYSVLNIGNESYKLRLNTKNSVALEKALGYNPITMLMAIEQGTMPTLGDMLTILQHMLQSYHHGFNMDRVYDLYDEYVADGHGMFELIPVFIEVFQNSGYLTTAKEGAGQDVDAKN